MRFILHTIASQNHDFVSLNRRVIQDRCTAIVEKIQNVVVSGIAIVEKADVGVYMDIWRITRLA